MERSADWMDAAEGDLEHAKLDRPPSSVRVFYPKFDQGQVLEAIVQGLPALRKTLPVKLLVLFGSYARGDYTIASDVDLLVVYQGPAREDAYAQVRKALGLRGLEPHVYSHEEYLQSKPALDLIIAKGIVLLQEGNYPRSASVTRARKTLRLIGNSLLALGILVVLTMGAYYAYSYYSLSQIDSFGENAIEGEAEALLDNTAAAAAQVEAAPVDTPPVGSPDLASFLAGAPGGPARAVAPLASTVGDDVPWEGLAYGPLGVFPATRIIIPSIEVDSRIIELGIVFEDGEWQWERPVRAVGHLKGTADPGQSGNVVMSGHISSPVRGEGQVFKRLPEIKLDDVVVLSTPVRSFAYRVTGKKVVLPSEINVLKPTTDETLTLITCVPDFIYSHRLIVTAKRVSAS